MEISCKPTSQLLSINLGQLLSIHRNKMWGKIVIIFIHLRQWKWFYKNFLNLEGLVKGTSLKCWWFKQRILSQRTIWQCIQSACQEHKGKKMIKHFDFAIILQGICPKKTAGLEDKDVSVPIIYNKNKNSTSIWHQVES